MSQTVATRNHGPPTTDQPSATQAVSDRGRSWLTRLLMGDPSAPSVAPVAIPHGDRSPAEIDALSRALGCPDLFLIDAPDRAARERLLSELSRLAAARGERVLVLTPDPLAADRITELLAADHTVPLIRTLAPDESPNRSSPQANRLTSAALSAGRQSQIRREAASAMAGVEAEVVTVKSAVVAARELHRLSEQFIAIENDRSKTLAHLQVVEEEVGLEANSPTAGTVFFDKLQKLESAQKEIIQPLIAAQVTASTKRKEVEASVQTHRHKLAESISEAAKKQGFLSRLIHKPRPQFDPSELEGKIVDAERSLAQHVEIETGLQAKIAATRERFDGERAKCISEQIGSRRLEIEAALKGLGEERDRIVGRFASGSRDLERAGFSPPAHLSAESVLRVLNELHVRQGDLESQLAIARARCEEVARTSTELTKKSLLEARIVVGIPGSLNSDPVFKSIATKPGFDLLLLDHAEEIADSDFANLSQLARRWVLVGAIVPRPTEPTRPGGAQTTRHPRDNRNLFAQRVSVLLDREPWAIEGDRLIFRLLHLPPDRRRQLEREPVVDRPEIELRLTTRSPGDIVLAEIAFPATTPVPAAKAFITSEVGEILLRPCSCHEWELSEGQIIVHWPAVGVRSEFEWVDLGQGMREQITASGSGTFTAAVTFDTAFGWNRESAEEWVMSKLAARNLGRVAYLA